MEKRKVEKKDLIAVEYIGTLDDGTVFDSSERSGRPLNFEAGSGQVIKGFDDGVLGMEEGQEKEIKILPADAYGELNPELMKKVPRSRLPLGMEIKEGMNLVASLPDGKRISAQVREVNDSEFTLDLNHPLAGKTLIFKIKVVKISSP